MIVEIDKTFEKDVKKVKDKKTLERIEKLILSLTDSDSLNHIDGVKKLSGFTDVYRFRIGPYRIGAKSDGEKITFVRFLHRKDIYKYFPK